MAVTTPGAYLIIARYNRDKWNGLGEEQEVAHETAEKVFPEKRHPVPQMTQEERQILRELPPEQLRPFQPLTLEKQAALQSRTLGEEVGFQPLPKEEFEDFLPLAAGEPEIPPQLQGVRLLNTFHTRAFVELAEELPTLAGPAPAKTVRAQPQNQTELEKHQRLVVDEILSAPGTREKDPGMGWIAVIDHDYYEDFVNALGGKAGPLWRMYDIEVIPLNADRTTKDFYDFMTPVSWKK